MRGESWIREDGRRRGGHFVEGMQATGDRWRSHELREMRCNVRRHDGAESVRKKYCGSEFGKRDKYDFHTTAAARLLTHSTHEHLTRARFEGLH